MTARRLPDPSPDPNAGKRGGRRARVPRRQSRYGEMSERLFHWQKRCGLPGSARHCCAACEEPCQCRPEEGDQRGRSTAPSGAELTHKLDESLCTFCAAHRRRAVFPFLRTHEPNSCRLSGSQWNLSGEINLFTGSMRSVGGDFAWSRTLEKI